MTKEQILIEIKEELKKVINAKETGAVELPKNIDVVVQGDIVKISLSSKAIGVNENEKDVCNMQDDEAAFEGWALVIYTYFAKIRNYKVQLKLKEDAYQKAQNFLEMGNYLGKRGHYYRFLYRVLRFSQQYEWFSLDVNLEKMVKDFDEYLRSGLSFTNNYPNGEKKISVKEVKKETENSIEDLFSDDLWQKSFEGKKLCQQFGMPIYRQLPVGLFEDKKKTEKAIFTGKKSAIDLWSSNDECITIYELKWKNKMVGIITELFFYCNYMRDMYGTGKAISQYHFVPHMVNVNRIRNEKKYRGYLDIYGRKFEKINGYMLYNKGELHQTITKNLLEDMNRVQFDTGETSINYGLIEYTVEERKLKIEQIYS